MLVFFTPSVEPLEVESTPVPLSPKKANPSRPGNSAPEGINNSETASLQPGQVYMSLYELPTLTGRIGNEDFGLASVTGRDDLVAIWTTREGEARCLLISAENAALYGLRDPVTDTPIGNGYIHRLEDRETWRQKRVEIMAERAGSFSSAFGAGASGLGGLVAAGPSAIISGITGGFDIISGFVEHYILGGYYYFAMKDTERDLANLFDEAYRNETQNTGDSK